MASNVKLVRLMMYRWSRTRAANDRVLPRGSMLLGKVPRPRILIRVSYELGCAGYTGLYVRHRQPVDVGNQELSLTKVFWKE